MRRGADLGGANGVTDFAQRLVTVRDDVDDAQAVKTLAHEAGHVLLHQDQGSRDCRGIIEVEAESVAYMVTSAHGLDSSQYTFNYVAGWALNAVTDQRDLADILRSTASASLARPTSSSKPRSRRRPSPTERSTPSKVTSGSRPTRRAGRQSPSPPQSPRNRHPQALRSCQPRWLADRGQS